MLQSANVGTKERCLWDIYCDWSDHTDNEQNICTIDIQKEGAMITYSARTVLLQHTLNYFASHTKCRCLILNVDITQNYSYVLQKLEHSAVTKIVHWLSLTEMITLNLTTISAFEKEYQIPKLVSFSTMLAEMWGGSLVIFVIMKFNLLKLWSRIANKSWPRELNL
jgi:hypothetical protein